MWRWGLWQPKIIRKSDTVNICKRSACSILFELQGHFKWVCLGNHLGSAGFLSLNPGTALSNQTPSCSGLPTIHDMPSDHEGQTVSRWFPPHTRSGPENSGYGVLRKSRCRRLRKRWAVAVNSRTEGPWPRVTRVDEMSKFDSHLYI